MNEIVAKKTAITAILGIPCGIILGILSVINYVAYYPDEIDVEVLWTCGFLAVSTITIFFLVIRSMAIPKVLIIADETGFLLKVTGEHIRFDAISYVSSKYSERKIIIITLDGAQYFITLVAKYKEVKNRIVQIVKEKTGRDIYLY